ncbi:hypothetical protein [Agromyces neolithicus]|uniref:Alcohol dehydrogenase-like C-terminal domain-containing protein n=1 Tax=Agromyces neolithicus TaxID=269420 RepID=A0ABN2MB56_9MICO
MRTSLWGTRPSLLELVEMAHRGEIRIETKIYPITDALQAYADLHDSKIPVGTATRVTVAGSGSCSLQQRRFAGPRRSAATPG